MCLQSGERVITFPTFGYFQINFRYSTSFLPSLLSNFRPELVNTYLVGVSNPSPFVQRTQWKKKVSITVFGSMFGRAAVAVKPENKSVIRICPGLLSVLSMVSTCTTSLNWSTSVSIMSEWCVHNLHLFII